MLDHACDLQCPQVHQNDLETSAVAVCLSDACATGPGLISQLVWELYSRAPHRLESQHTGAALLFVQCDDMCAVRAGETTQDKKVSIEFVTVVCQLR